MTRAELKDALREVLNKHLPKQEQSGALAVTARAWMDAPDDIGLDDLDNIFDAWNTTMADLVEELGLAPNKRN